MSTHPLLRPEVLEMCAETIVATSCTAASKVGKQTHSDSVGMRRRWASALDKLQGTHLSEFVVDEHLQIIDPSFRPLPSTSRRARELLDAMAFLQRSHSALYKLLNAYVVGIVMVDRVSSQSSELDSSVDVHKATFGLWHPGLGRFVGSSTGHLGLLWVEAGLAQSDLVCGVVHEFIHLALNLLDMATGIFCDCSYDGSVQAVSPLLKVSRPYALAMHALMVKSALGHMGLRMSRDPPEDFQFEHAAVDLLAVAPRALTVQGQDLLNAVRAFEHCSDDIPALWHPRASTCAVRRYTSRHASPTLLFWGDVDWHESWWQLCYDISDVGAVVFDGLMLVKQLEKSAYDKDGEYTTVDWREQVTVLEDFQSISEEPVMLEQGSKGTVLRYSNTGNVLLQLSDLEEPEQWVRKGDISKLDFEQPADNFELPGESAGSRTKKAEKLSFDDFKKLDKFQRGPIPDMPGTIFDAGKLAVEYPWETKFVDVSASFDCLHDQQIDQICGDFKQKICLPCGMSFDAAKSSTELTVAEACGLQPPLLVTVMPEPGPEPGELRLACIGALSGERLGALDVLAAESTAFGKVRQDLAAACGLAAGTLRLLSPGGMQLDVARAADTVASLFPSALQELAPTCSCDV